MVFVTIGQSPRIDVIPELMAIMGKDFEYEEIGLLDDPQKLQSLKEFNIGDDELLVSRLRNGQEVKISRSWVIHELKNLNLDTRELKVLLCTERFCLPDFILPSEILEAFVVIFRPKKLGVVVPAKDQMEMVRKKWKSFVSNIKMTYFSPYTKTQGDLIILADRDLTILDCMGYDIEDEKYIRSYTDGIVVSARRLLANFLRNFITIDSVNSSGDDMR